VAVGREDEMAIGERRKKKRIEGSETVKRKDFTF